MNIVTDNFVLMEGSPTLQVVRAGGLSGPSLIHLLFLSHEAQNLSILGTKGIVVDMN